MNGTCPGYTCFVFADISRYEVEQLNKGTQIYQLKMLFVALKYDRKLAVYKKWLNPSKSMICGNFQIFGPSFLGTIHRVSLLDFTDYQHTELGPWSWSWKARGRVSSCKNHHGRERMIFSVTFNILFKLDLFQFLNYSHGSNFLCKQPEWRIWWWK